MEINLKTKEMELRCSENNKENEDLRKDLRGAEVRFEAMKV